MKLTNEVHLLIDGDVLLFQASAATETPIDWGDGLWTLHSFLPEALNILEDSISDITQAVEQQGYEIKKLTFTVSDPKNNFRKQLWEGYKANRKGSRKPVCYFPLREELCKKYTVCAYPSLEGDDVLGILATEPSELTPVIVSVDKDFKTIPCIFYNFNHDEFLTNTEEEADRFHAYQTLVGDTADGYKGCPSYGHVKASKLLATLKTSKERWQAVINAFINEGCTKEDALLQARLSHILHYEDYDIKSNKIKLWEFPHEL